MRRPLVLGLLLVSVLAAGVSAQWEYGADTGFAFTRFDGEFYWDGLIYFLGGRLADGNTSGQIWSFDWDGETYANTGAVMPFPVSNYDLNILNDGTQEGIYLIGGRLSTGSSCGYVQVYYPDSNTAVRITGDDWPASPARIPGAVVEYDNKLYVFGGFNSAGPTFMFADTWVYDPLAAAGSRWTQAASANLAVARSYIYACVVDGYIYAIGGDVWDGVSALLPQTICERLDPNDLAAGWDDASVADLPTATGEGRAFGFGSSMPSTMAGHIIIAGGGVWPDQSAACYDYDTATDTWTAFDDLNLARRNHAAAIAPYDMDNMAIWVFGGRYLDDTSVTQTSERHLIDLETQPTRTPTPAPTATPEQPTATPTEAATATPVPTATPELNLGVRLDLPAHVSPGEPFYVDGFLDNPDAMLEDVPVFFILAVYGEYYFWPSWVHYLRGDAGTIDFDQRDVPAGTTEIEVLAEFNWPDTGTEEVTGLFFYGAMLNAAMDDLLGEMAIEEWSYGP